MDFVLRAGRAYWRFNKQVWGQIQRATMPLLALAGVWSAAAWMIGVQTGNTPLLWTPALYAGALMVGVLADRR
jgi:hypothetical protein